MKPLPWNAEVQGQRSGFIRVQDITAYGPRRTCIPARYMRPLSLVAWKLIPILASVVCYMSFFTSSNQKGCIYSVDNAIAGRATRSQ
jgi:hypothetical protein